MLDIIEHKSELFPDLVERIWIAENTEKEVEIIIPPNQYVNLIIPLNNSKYKRNQVWLTTPHIEGISSTNTILKYPVGTKLIGIRFFAFGMFPFFQIQGNKVFNTSFELTNLEEIIAYSNTDSNAVLMHKTYTLLSRLFSKTSYDNILRIRDFYNQFRWNDDICSIEEYCKTIHTNYSALNRNFTKIVGVSPKKFERLIKFRKSLCSLVGTDDSLTSIAINSGYFDQAHFIREFKKFLNDTPSNYQSFIHQENDTDKMINYNFKLF